MKMRASAEASVAAANKLVQQCEEDCIAAAQALACAREREAFGCPKEFPLTPLPSFPDQVSAATRLEFARAAARAAAAVLESLPPPQSGDIPPLPAPPARAALPEPVCSDTHPLFVAGILPASPPNAAISSHSQPPASEGRGRGGRGASAGGGGQRQLRGRRGVHGAAGRRHVRQRRRLQRSSARRCFPHGGECGR